MLRIRNAAVVFIGKSDEEGSTQTRPQLIADIAETSELAAMREKDSLTDPRRVLLVHSQFWSPHRVERPTPTAD